MSDKKQVWLATGYALFALEGPQALKVERLARTVQKSKSSFYHLFADQDSFIEDLLSLHLLQARAIAEKERACSRLVPDLLHVLVEHKLDLLFNRQLRVNRTIDRYRSCFEKANNEVGEAIVSIWADGLGLAPNSGLALMVLQLSMENFFLQITEETLTYEWLEEYIIALKRMVTAFGREANLKRP